MDPDVPENQRFYKPVPQELDNVFRNVEKYYKRPPAGAAGKRIKKTQDFSQVLDFADISNNSPENLSQIIDISQQLLPTQFQGENLPVATKAYTIRQVPGLIFIPNPFTPAQQCYWVKRCVKDFTVNNPTNLSNLKMIQYRKIRTDNNQPIYDAEDDAYEKSILWQNWDLSLMSDLRWATVGYHFQWTRRQYVEDKRGVFPEDLAQLCENFAGQLGYKMTAEAATINFYPDPRYLMGGHIDDAERDMSKPIVSVSFGNTVIFLIGGRSREDPPVALYIRSGDIVLMGGESRFCYHGVPRMIENSAPEFFNESNSPDEIRYAHASRINVNARQVNEKTL